ncbi:hypothetical protein OSB04_009006 [Centaurea solstitialis]|uniref:Uncharacterized protein n=1 Tax=Centaurea solstitialis TaxID=347529 RepID=A0AA38TYD7_9ASTR|nr:hypothetical protein OSB04_009006 [Centaurea solstitialis]
MGWGSLQDRHGKCRFFSCRLPLAVLPEVPVGTDGLDALPDDGKRGAAVGGGDTTTTTTSLPPWRRRKEEEEEEEEEGGDRRACHVEAAHRSSSRALRPLRLSDSDCSPAGFHSSSTSDPFSHSHQFRDHRCCFLNLEDDPPEDDCYSLVTKGMNSRH